LKTAGLIHSPPTLVEPPAGGASRFQNWPPGARFVKRCTRPSKLPGHSLDSRRPSGKGELEAVAGQHAASQMAVAGRPRRYCLKPVCADFPAGRAEEPAPEEDAKEGQANQARQASLRALDEEGDGAGRVAVHGQPFYTVRALRLCSKPKPRRKRLSVAMFFRDWLM